MPNKRDLNLTKYNIDRYQYRELKYFCLQYRRKKQQASFLLKTVCKYGENRDNKLTEQLIQDCQLIEQSAVEADPELYQYIIEGTTQEDCPYWALQTRYNMPCGKCRYENARRRFYYILAVKKNMVDRRL